MNMHSPLISLTTTNGTGIKIINLYGQFHGYWCLGDERVQHIWSSGADLNILRPRQNGCRFPDDIFKCIFLNENAWISLKISLIFVPKVRINNIPALVQIMAWRRPGYKPLSEPKMVSLLTHICVTRPQWVNLSQYSDVHNKGLNSTSDLQKAMQSIYHIENGLYMHVRTYGLKK